MIMCDFFSDANNNNNYNDLLSSSSSSSLLILNNSLLRSQKYQGVRCDDTFLSEFVDLV
jgi:hypothetical protein